MGSVFGQSGSPRALDHLEVLLPVRLDALFPGVAGGEEIFQVVLRHVVSHDLILAEKDNDMQSRARLATGTNGVHSRLESETMREIAPRIVVDERIASGKPVIRGTRVPVALVVGKLAGGMTAALVAQEYELDPQDPLAVLSFAGG